MTPATEAAAPCDVVRGQAQRALAGLDRLWAWMVTARPSVLVTLLVVLVVGRSGVGFPRMDVPFGLALAERLPEALPDWRSGSIVGPALARLAGVDDEGGWFALHALMVMAAAVAIGACIARRAPTREGRIVVATWLALASFPVAVLQRVGEYDVFTVLGAFLVVYPRARAWAVVGGVLIGLTNAEQGVAGLVVAALVLVALRPDGDGWLPAATRLRTRAPAPALALGLAGVVAARALLLAGFAAQGVSVPSRGDLFGSLLGSSLVNSLSAGGSGVYAWLGPAWAVVALSWFLHRWTIRRWAELVAALVVIPAAVTVTTLDGSRVFAMVSLPGLLVLVGWIGDRVSGADGAGDGVA
ncbi:MAG TPA: hypothetical protein VGO60_01455, partial [Iamia sp.]|nr:hypothetical protein [Iamia sp.]